MPIDRDEMQRRLVEEFRVEARERLAALQDHLLSFEHTASDAPLALEPARRQAHTLKGAAHSIGLGAFADSIHAFESRLGTLDDTIGPPPRATLDVLLWSLDEYEKAVNARDLVAHRLSHVGTALRAGERPSTATDDTPPVPAPPGSMLSPGNTVPAASDDALPVPAAPVATTDHSLRRSTDGQKTIRIGTHVVDRLINEVGELLVTGGVHGVTADELLALGRQIRNCRSQIRHALAAPESNDSAAWLREELDVVTNQLDRWTETITELATSVRKRGNLVANATSAVHDSVMETRMLPASALFRRYPRMVRELSHQLARPVDLITEGDDCQLDWMIIERIEEPVLHLIRNALTHGLEPAEVRLATGKPAAGRVTLRAVLRGHMVVVEVEDDGAGIDLAAVRARAEQRGLLSADRNREFTIGDATDLMFTSGFSTVHGLTDLAGRGVGLDVVKRTVEELGGAIDVRSEPSRGSCFSLSVPITLATFRGIIVRARGASFALPQASVARVVRFAPSELQSMGGRASVRIDGSQVAVASLAAVLGLPGLQGAPPPWHRALVVRAAEKQVALLVDEIVDQREMVVKSLGYYFRRVPHFAGATILGNGAIVPILHVADCVRSATEAADRMHVSAAANAPADEEERRKSILVVDDSLTTRTLERGILEGEGFRVGVAVDGREAQELLARQHFDLVVSDIQMPQVDGLELTRWIRAEPRIRHLPIVLVSALDTPDDRARGLEAGADAYIGKRSFDQPTLIATIRRLL
ncbi:MAG: response regulator [Planctomycetota bacterium]